MRAIRVQTNWCFIIGLIFSLCLPISFNAYADQGKIDLTKTISYIKRLEKRDDFPVSVTFAYYYFKSLNLLGAPIPNEPKVEAIKFLLLAQRRAGGFAQGIKGYSPSTPVATYFALAALKCVHQTKKINKLRALRYLLSLKNDDGGFAFKKGRPSSLSATYYCIMSLKFLNSLNTIDKSATVRYIKRFKDPDSGGFSAAPNMPANLRATYWAYQCLNALDALAPITTKGMVRFMAATRYAGQPSKRPYGFPKIDEAAMVYEVLHDLGAMELIDKKRAISFVKGLYIPFNGGFGPFPGYGSTPPSTYHAVQALNYLGVLKAQSQKD